MVSIIIPVYNVEKHLPRCMESVLNQTYSDLEIILIDDGSTDSSGKICDEYASTDTRIKVIHKENEGIAQTRNVGLKNSTGDYICFVDSDDYANVDMVEFLLSTIGGCEMSTGGVINDYVSGSAPQYPDLEKNFETDNITAFTMILEGKLIVGGLFGKLIESSIAKSLTFLAGRIYEDACFFNSLMLKLKRVHVSTKPVYHYVHREKSLTTSRFKSSYMDAIYAYSQTKKLVEQYPALKKYANFRLIWAHFTVLDRMLLLEKYWTIPEYKKIIKFLKSNAFAAANNKLFTKNRRIAALALKLNVKLYRYLLLKNEENNKKLFS